MPPNNRGQQALSLTFAIDLKPAGPFLPIVTEVKKGNNPVRGAKVTLIKSEWSREFVCDNNGNCSFLPPLAETENHVYLIATVTIGNGAPQPFSTTWIRPTETEPFAKFLDVRFEETDTPGLLFLHYYTKVAQGDSVGIQDLIEVICMGKTIIGADFGVDDGGEPRNKVTLSSNEQGEGHGWIRLEEKGKATLTVSLSGGIQPTQFKLEKAAKPKEATLTAVKAKTGFRTAPLTITVNGALTRLGKPGRCKLVSTGRINAQIIGGDVVCNNAAEGAFSTDGEGKTQIRITLPDDVSCVSIHIEAEEDSAIRSEVITVNHQPS